MATPEQLAFMRDYGRVSTVIELRAMARSERQRTLVELKAVDDAYPLLGAVGFGRVPGGAASAADALAQRDGVWGAALERATMTRLGVGIGDTIQVGDARFMVRARVDGEPDRTANPITLGPRVMIALPALDATRLIQPGSLARSMYRVVLRQASTPRPSPPPRASAFRDAGWRIRSISEAAPGMQRWIDRIAMFLTLVGLTALLVGGVGVANAVKNYLDGQARDHRTLKCPAGWARSSSASISRRS
jgi:putative ABC transport system permease protein